MEYSPSAFVTVERTAPVAPFVTVTVAPGSTAPPWSTMRPLMVAVAWANAQLLVASTSATVRPTLFSICFSFSGAHNCSVNRTLVIRATIGVGRQPSQGLIDRNRQTAYSLRLEIQ